MTVYRDIHKDVIESCKAGNSRAQHQLYQLYARAMYNICYRMMNSKEEAEDMLQESFAEAFHHLNDYRGDSTFGAWLKRITINKCINTLKRRRAQLIPYEDVPETIDVRNDDEKIPGLTIDRVQKAMAMLPEGYRIVFSLYLLEGYDHSEISEILGVTEATSKSQYCRAKQKIKEIIISQKYERQV